MELAAGTVKAVARHQKNDSAFQRNTTCNRRARFRGSAPGWRYNRNATIVNRKGLFLEHKRWAQGSRRRGNSPRYTKVGRSYCCTASHEDCIMEFVWCRWRRQSGKAMPERGYNAAILTYIYRPHMGSNHVTTKQQNNILRARRLDAMPRNRSCAYRRFIGGLLSGFRSAGSVGRPARDIVVGACSGGCWL